MVRATTDTGDGAVVRRLVLGSALMLFLELALIRWLGSNIVHLSYFSNFVLLGSFLGIGIGFLLSRRRWTLVPAAPLLLAALVGGVTLFPVTLDRTGNDVIYFTSLQAQRTARLAGAADGVRRRGPGDRGAGRDRRPLLRGPHAADGVPLGPGGLARRDQRVHACCRSSGRRRSCGA